eukprot:11761910-Ditylum_brightwellii.AAC.1
MNNVVVISSQESLWEGGIQSSGQQCVTNKRGGCGDQGQAQCQSSNERGGSIGAGMLNLEGNQMLQ